jgi:hypothetical protein
VLTDSQKRLYSRQILLSEIGFPGQERICGARVRLVRDTDADARSVAREYLVRAGVQVVDEHDAHDAVDAADGGIVVGRAGHEVDVARFSGLSGDPRLAPAVRYLAGSMVAVEALKQILGQGRAGTLPDSQVFTISRAKEKQ